MLPAMAAMELACAAGAYICADRHAVVTNSVLGASLALHTAATLDITCDLRTGSLSIQSVLSCTLVLSSEVILFLTCLQPSLKFTPPNLEDK